MKTSLDEDSDTPGIEAEVVPPVELPYSGLRTTDRIRLLYGAMSNPTQARPAKVRAADTQTTPAPQVRQSPAIFDAMCSPHRLHGRGSGVKPVHPCGPGGSTEPQTLCENKKLPRGDGTSAARCRPSLRPFRQGSETRATTSIPDERVGCGREIRSDGSPQDTRQTSHGRSARVDESSRSSPPQGEVASLVEVVRHLWHPLGLVDFPLAENLGTDCGSSLQKVDVLVRLLETNYDSVLASLRPQRRMGADTQPMKQPAGLLHALWWVLYKTTAYCVPLSTRRRSALPTAPEDVSKHYLQDSLDASDALFSVDVLPLSHWAYILHHMANFHYPRDQFYQQTPAATEASPHELLLALLWLTKEFKLVAAAEYVVMCHKYHFLLDVDGFPGRSSAPARSRLLSDFPMATVWPPKSFNEEASLAFRRRQIVRISGNISAVSSTNSERAGASSPTSAVRRIMALRRLVELSLNRLEHSLTRRAEQVGELGLHSCLDAQMCHRDNRDEYQQVMDGLHHVDSMHERVSRRILALSAAASMVARCVREVDHPVPVRRDLLRALSDDGAWIGEFSAGGDVAGSIPVSHADDVSSSRVAKTLQCAILPATLAATCSSMLLFNARSKFQASRCTQSLRNLWRNLVRRGVDSTGVSFVSDADAQRSNETQVRINLGSRYSLRAALSAELLILQYLHVEDATSSSHHGLRSKDVAPMALSVRRRERDTVEGETMLCDGCLQVSIVGEPTADSTTSARVVQASLQRSMQELQPASEVAERASREASALRQKLFDCFGLQVAHRPTSQKLGAHVP